MRNEFTPGAEVAVRQISKTEWVVMRPYSYGRVRVTEGTPTDFASVPRPFTWLLPRYGNYTKAAIVHDVMWRSWVPQSMTRREADATLREMLLELDVAFWRRWAMWAAVRVGSLAHRDGRKGWWKDAPRVALVAVAVLPVIAIPSLAVVAGLIGFYALEGLTWLVLRPFSRKRVNTPSLLVNQ